MAVGLQDPWLAKRMGLSADSACARAPLKIFEKLSPIYFYVHPHDRLTQFWSYRRQFMIHLNSDEVLGNQRG
jgi:hypothetical protein